LDTLHFKAQTTLGHKSIWHCCLRGLIDPTTPRKNCNLTHIHNIFIPSYILVCCSQIPEAEGRNSKDISGLAFRCERPPNALPRSGMRSSPNYEVFFRRARTISPLPPAFNTYRDQSAHCCSCAAALRAFLSGYLSQHLYQLHPVELPPLIQNGGSDLTVSEEPVRRH